MGREEDYTIEPGANLSGADLMYANLTGADLMYANLTGADLTGAILNGAILNGAILKDATLEDANLRSANLRSANLWGANLTGANLTDANLTDANLTDANLTDATMPDEANLTGATMPDEANLTGVKSGDIEPWPEAERLARLLGHALFVLVAVAVAVAFSSDGLTKLVLASLLLLVLAIVAEHKWRGFPYRSITVLIVVTLAASATWRKGMVAEGSPYFSEPLMVSPPHSVWGVMIVVAVTLVLYLLTRGVMTIWRDRLLYLPYD